MTHDIKRIYILMLNAHQTKRIGSDLYMISHHMPLHLGAPWLTEDYITVMKKQVRVTATR